MSNKRFLTTLLVVVLISIAWSGLLAAENLTGNHGKPAADQKYDGTWEGSYSVDNGYTNKLSYTLGKDDKGQWRGTVKYTNEAGEHSGDMKAIVIADGKFKAKFETWNGQGETTSEGAFNGDQLAGTYAVSPKGSTEVVEKGAWKVVKTAAPKSGRQ